MMKKHTPNNSPDLSLTEKVDKLRQAGLADSDIDAILSDGNKSDSDAIEAYNRRVDETVDMAAWETKVGAVFAVIFFVAIFQFLARTFFHLYRNNFDPGSLSSSPLGSNELVIMFFTFLTTAILVCIVTNIRSIPLYFKNARHFLKK
jgi:hypothetical protein